MMLNNAAEQVSSCVASAACSKSFDLGQFERFRRIMHIPAYRPLLNHEEVMTLSTLKVRAAAASELILQLTNRWWYHALSF
jgi:hypothetical protein